MNLSLILLQLGGAALLLLYAVHLVRTGMERAYAQTLRRFLGEAAGGRLQAAFGGTAMAVLLQSSTAVAMLTCGFAASGLLAFPTGLAVLLGADLGSALIVRLLSFDLGWLMPVCLLLGGVLHLKVPGRLARETGRIVLGIGFVLLSLRLIGEATGPLREAGALPMFAGYLAQDFATAFLVGALFTWLIHSSVAAILMIAAFASQGLIPWEAGVPIVLGANVGSGLIAFWLSRGMPAAARRIPIGNLLFRAGGALAVLAIAESLGLPVSWFGGDAGMALVNLHVAFNAALLLVSLPLVGLAERGLLWLVREPKAPETAADPRTSALDATVIDTPRLALASATRELLRMGEMIEQMFAPVIDMLANGPGARVTRLRQLEEAINDTHSGIKLYIARVNRGLLNDNEAQRGIELTDVAINLEHVGDIIAKNLFVLAEERTGKGLQFSADGLAELSELHDCVIQNLRLALNVLLSNDLSAARQLAGQKEHVRALERRSHDRHLKRLQAGAIKSVETSDIHLEAIRAFKEINSLLVSIAYPLLTESGDLLPSRLAARG